MLLDLNFSRSLLRTNTTTAVPSPGINLYCILGMSIIFNYPSKIFSYNLKPCSSNFTSLYEFDIFYFPTWTLYFPSLWKLVPLRSTSIAVASYPQYVCEIPQTGFQDNLWLPASFTTFHIIHCKLHHQFSALLAAAPH